MRLRPTRRALLLVAAGAGPALLPVVAGLGWTPWTAWIAACALLLLTELLLLPGPARLSASLSTPEHLYVGAPAEARLRVARAPGARPRSLRVRLETDERLQPPPTAALDLSSGPVEDSVLPLLALRRGPARLQRLWLAWTGPLGLLELHTVPALGRELPVLADVRPARAVASAPAAASARPGNKLLRAVGEGSAFDSLRPWVAGLDRRGIDWKATARHLRLTSRQHRAETDQPLVLVFDTGRLMSEPLAGVSRLDRSLEQGLALAAAALRAGDRVGLASFGARPGVSCAPVGGLAAWAGLQRLAARIEYGEHDSNVTLGLLTLLQSLRRRTLVVVFTDFADPITASLLVEGLGHVARRHLVLFVTLADPLLERLESARPDEPSDVHRAVVAADRLRERAGVLARLRRRGVSVLETRPDHAAAEVVARYLALKRRERIG